MKNDNAALIIDLEQDYKKLGIECKKKYNIVREVIDISIKAIEKLIKLLIEENNSQKFNEELLLSSEILLKPFLIISEKNHSKLYLYSAQIIKKLVVYNFVNSENSETIILILKNMFENSSEDIQLKILETLQSMINSNKIKIEEKIINNILYMSIKMFTFKIVEFKNPIRLQLKTLIKIIVESFNNEEDKKDKIKIETIISTIKLLLDISEGKKKEWVYPTIYTKCLGLELLSNIISISPKNIFIDVLEIKNLVETDLAILIQKMITITNDTIIGVKLVKLIIIISDKLNLCYNLLDNIISFAERDNISWQKIIGLEGISELLNSSSLIYNLYINNNKLYQKLLKSLTNVTFKNILNSNNDNSYKKNDNKISCSLINKKNKFINNDSILIEGETINIITTQNYLFKLFTECYDNLKNSYILLMEDNNLKVDQQNQNLNKEQLLIQDLLKTNYVDIKGALSVLLINTNNESMIQIYLNIFQSFISLYSSLLLFSIRDEYINVLCKLALPNNLESFFEMKEKNILITRTIFNISHCNNLLDFNSWKTLLETIQNLYYILINSNNYSIKPNEKYQIDIIVKNLETTIKKFSYDTSSIEIHEIIKKTEEQMNFININEQKSNLTTSKSKYNKELNTNISMKKKNYYSSTQVNNSITNIKRELKEEEKENMFILSNVIDTLFIDSQKYEIQNLYDILKALFNSSETLLNNYNDSDELNSENIITSLQFNLVKTLELGVINIHRINLLWDNIIKLIELFRKSNIQELSSLSIEILGVLIIFILSKYKCVDSDKDDNNWKTNKWQVYIFETFSNIINIKQNIINVDLYLLTNFSRIVQKCGQVLDDKGWIYIIKILSNLIKNNEQMIERIFQLIEQMFNEYSGNLTIFIVDSIIDILEQFSLNKANDNISYSAIALFWSCANIIETYQKNNNNNMNEESIKIIKNSWEKLFSKLININKDERFDSRKSGINLFSQFFVEKINSISSINISQNLVKNIFFNILIENNNTFIFIQDIKEWEDTIIISLQATSKILKAFISENKNIDNTLKTDLFKEYVNILTNIIIYQMPDISMNILKILTELTIYDNDLLINNFDILWKLINEIGNYLKTDIFIKKHCNFNIGSKLIISILDSFKLFFFSHDENKLLLNDEKNVNYLLNICRNSLISARYTEGNTPVVNPLKLLRTEKEVFNFIEELTKNISQSQIIKLVYSFLTEFLNRNEEDPHSEALSRQSYQTLQQFFNLKDLNFEFKNK